jgi:hypothetical protein
MVKTYEELRADRFWNKVDKPSPHQCWQWKAARQSSGYGAFAYKPKHIVTAHRVSWALTNNSGVLPDSKLVVMHLCDNKLCVNPSHLTLATVAVNNLDAINKRIRLSIEEHVGIPILNEFCRHGHPRTLENTTFRKKDGYPYALCKVCLRIRSREAKRKMPIELKRALHKSWRIRKAAQHTTHNPLFFPIPLPVLTERAPGKSKFVKVAKAKKKGKKRKKAHTPKKAPRRLPPPPPSRKGSPEKST